MTSYGVVLALVGQALSSQHFAWEISMLGAWLLQVGLNI